MKKTLDEIITESINKLILEVTREDFSLAKMDAMQSPDMRCGYCSSHLGTEIGEGSSRTVFLLSDEHVLKLAYGHSSDSGADQNKVEFELSHSNQPYGYLFPRVFQHADDFSWIISEHVVDATIVDFYKVLGMPFESSDELDRIHAQFDKIPIEDDGKYEVKDWKNNTVKRKLRFWDIGNDYRDYEKYGHSLSNQYDENQLSFLDFVRWFNLSYGQKQHDPNTPYFCSLLSPTNPTHQWFDGICSYIQANNGYTDFDIDNFGLALRNGKPTLVLLDSGYNEAVAKQYYGG